MMNTSPAGRAGTTETVMKAELAAALLIAAAAPTGLMLPAMLDTGPDSAGVETPIVGPA